MQPGCFITSVQILHHAVTTVVWYVIAGAEQGTPGPNAEEPSQPTEVTAAAIQHVAVQQLQEVEETTGNGQEPALQQPNQALAADIAATAQAQLQSKEAEDCTEAGWQETGPGSAAALAAASPTDSASLPQTDVAEAHLRLMPNKSQQASADEIVLEFGTRHALNHTANEVEDTKAAVWRRRQWSHVPNTKPSHKALPAASTTRWGHASRHCFTSVALAHIKV